MAEKKVMDYSNSAVNLCNPPEIGLKLINYQDCQARVRTLEANLLVIPEFEELQACQKQLADLNAQIRNMIDALGSYQNIENGFYAIKSIRKAKQYHAQPFIESYPKYAPAVIEQSVNVKALEGLVKGQLLVEAELVSAGVITTTESYAYIIK